MLIVHRAERADRLVDELAGHIGDEDPFTPDVVAVATRGIERWVTQQLAQRSGICANVRFPSPRAIVTDAVARASGIDPDEDPWHPAHAAWTLAEVIDAHAGEEWLATLQRYLDGAPEPYGRHLGIARRLAALFDRYARHRPQMITSWALGDLVDEDGSALPPDLVWQARLWGHLQQRLAHVPHPAERIDAACARLLREPQLVELPNRLSLFGLTRLPAADLEVLQALAAGREVHLLLLHPSPALWQRLAESAPKNVRRRRDDPTPAVPQHPLLASWGRDVRELQLLLGTTTPAEHHPVDLPATTLLGRLQHQVREDAPPETVEPLGSGDQSVQIHACHGRARQVEVLRDCVLGLLADDETLEPRDVLVMCPNIENFAPLISATFGAGRVEQDTEADDDGSHPPGLRVRLADRAVRQTNPVLGAVSTLLDLVAGRMAASAVLDLADREPVRRRFAFDDDDLGRLERWVAGTGIRWGLEAGHRAPFNLDMVPDGTWRRGLDRVLLGTAIAEDGGRLWHGVLPLDDVDSGAIDLAGRFAELVDRLDHAHTTLGAYQPMSAWAVAIAEAADAITDVGPRDAWQRRELHRVLDDLVREAGDAAIDVTPAEMRELLADRLGGRATRANFRTGALTVCTLMPMRSVPHRVICLLGLDDGVFPRGAARDGDDLLLREPCIGERDPRSEDRQLLLDALMATTQTLVVTYTGKDERTNAHRPPAVPVTELLDAVAATAGPRAREAVVTHHSLQPFDPKNFRTGDPWSFDRRMRDGAAALRSATRAPARLLAAPLLPPTEEIVALDDLVRFVEHPVKAFLRQRLGVRVSDLPEEISDELTIEADGLAKYALGDRLLRGRLAGVDEAELLAAERARGELPPAGALQTAVLTDVRPTVAAIARLAEGALKDPSRSQTRDVRVVLGDGRALAGTVTGVAGDTLQLVSYATLKAKHELGAWVRLLALVAAGEPVRQAVTVGRAGKTGTSVTSDVPAEGDRQAWALEQLAKLVDLRDRGLREPLPLACEAAAAYAAAAPHGPEAAIERATKAWKSGYNAPKEDQDPEHVLAFGGTLAFEQLWTRALPAPDEAAWAPGVPSRFGALATRLWEGPLRWRRT
ncbi:MAG TPA: exodeoxyribonuclease V subunit gamma [Baekduia sp.]|nr:exodeoxyribonuclease V subunit gamma [Baekduia sp.]